MDAMAIYGTIFIILGCWNYSHHSMLSALTFLVLGFMFVAASDPT